MSVAAQSEAVEGPATLLAWARMDAAGAWLRPPPIIHGDSLNNHLAHAQLLVHQGRYYVFWSTRHSEFAPDGANRAGR